MWRRMMLAAAAALLLAPPVLAADAGITVRVQGFEQSKAKDSHYLDLLQAVDQYNALEWVSADNSVVNLASLLKNYFVESDIAVEVDRYLASNEDETSSGIRPDFLIAPRADSYPQFDSAPPPRVIGILKSRVVHLPPKPLWWGLASIHKNARECTAPPDEFVVLAYLDDDSLEDDQSVPRVLSALQTLTHQSNVLVEQATAAATVGSLWMFPHLQSGDLLGEPIYVDGNGKMIHSYQNPTLMDWQESWHSYQKLLDQPGDPWGFIVAQFVDDSGPWVGSRGNVSCPVIWDFYRLTSQGWKLAESDALTVRVDWASHPALQLLVSEAIVSGHFARRNLVLSIRHEAPNFEYGSRGRYLDEWEKEYIRMIDDIIGTTYSIKDQIGEAESLPDIVITTSGRFASIGSTVRFGDTQYENVGGIEYESIELRPGEWEYWRKLWQHPVGRIHRLEILSAADADADPRVSRFLDGLKSAVDSGLGLSTIWYGDHSTWGFWTVTNGEERTTSPRYVIDWSC